MLFRDILNVEHDQSGTVDIHSLRVMLPDTPEDVLEQFYTEHGRKEEFQRQYGSLVLEKIKWSREAVVAEEILKCEIHTQFQKRVADVADRAQQFSEKGWRCIDKRRKVVTHWEMARTWERSPIFLEGRILGFINPLRLVEGHTRVGCLRGLVNVGVLAPGSTHDVWVGRSASPN